MREKKEKKIDIHKIEINTKNLENIKNKYIYIL